MRFNAELTEERYQKIEELMELTGITTKKDLLINALILFGWAVRQRREGRTIASIDDDAGNYREFILPALENVPVEPKERMDLEAFRARVKAVLTRLVETGDIKAEAIKEFFDDSKVERAISEVAEEAAEGEEANEKVAAATASLYEEDFNSTGDPEETSDPVAYPIGSIVRRT